MAIGQVDINHAMTRIQELTAQRHQEDQRGAIVQNQLQGQFAKTVDNQARQVTRPEQMERREKKYDAKEKGDGEYQGDGGKRRRKKEKPEEGVYPKAQSGFDMKI